MKHVLLLSLLGAGLTAALPGAAQGQPQNRPAAVPVTVVLMNRLQYPDVSFVILRRTTASPRDVILLRSDAVNAPEFSAAVMALLTARRQEGDTTTANKVVRARPQAAAPGRARTVLPWAQSAVNKLRNAKPRAIEGVGTVPAVDVWLPPQRSQR